MAGTRRTPPKRDSLDLAKNVRITFQPATPDRWPDVEKLFGPRGACGGCWCMVWRRTAAEWPAAKGEPNRRAFRKIIADGPPPGVLAYAGKEPIGWCAVAPRETYVRLQTSRVLKPLDDQPVWSISCLFVARAWRRRGISSRLADAAAQLARRLGAKIVEAYPVLPRTSDMPAAFAWTGVPGSFERAGFTEAGRHSRSRPILRRRVK